MADAKFNLSAAPGVSGYIGIKFYKASAPTVEVGSTQIAGPHTAEVAVVYPGLDPVTHIVRIYDTPGFPTLGTLLHEFWLDVRSNTVTNERRFYTVDGSGTYDPASGGTSVSDPYLTGKTITGIFKEGFGLMNPTQYTLTSTGFTLSSPYTLSSGEVYCIEVSYAVSAPPVVSSSGTWSDLVAHTADFTLVSTDMGKIHSFESSTSRIVATLPTLSGLADNTIVKFISYAGSQINGTISAPGTDTIKYNGGTVQKLYLGSNESIALIKKSSAWYVMDEKSDYNDVGRVLFADKLLPNTVKAEGQVLNRLDYPRLWAFANSLGVNLLADGTRISDIKYCGFFSSGDGSATFRLPDLRGVFLRGLDGTRGLDPDRASATPSGQNTTPGYYQIDAVGQHKHTNVTAANATHATSSSAGSGMQKLLTGNTAPVNEFTINQFDSGDVYEDAGLTILGSESRGKNIAKYALIKY